MTASVSENPYRIDFTYGPDNQRIKSVLKNNGATIKTKYFSPGYEKEVTTSGTREITYINSPYGLVAVDIRRNGTDSLYYVESDHLGSIIGLVRADGTYRERYSYDAWGRRRIPKNWSYDTIPAARVIDRGFTGHEHLDEFKLINMNGRMYDPVVARFLGVDPVIQYGDNSQSYNGYSYCLNNPLKYSDPTGYNVYQIKKEYWAKVLAQGDLFNLDDLGQEYGDILGGNSRNDTNMPDVSGVSTYLQSDLKIQIISLGKGQPTIIATTTINPRNGEWGSKIELVIRVFGEGYSEYNFVQSFFNNFQQS
jgi:RHS repeat-associated protein